MARTWPSTQVNRSGSKEMDLFTRLFLIISHHWIIVIIIVKYVAPNPVFAMREIEVPTDLYERLAEVAAERGITINVVVSQYVQLHRKPAL